MLLLVTPLDELDRFRGCMGICEVAGVVIVTFVEAALGPPQTALAAKNRVPIGGTSGLGDPPTWFASAKGERMAGEEGS